MIRISFTFLLCILLSAGAIAQQKEYSRTENSLRVASYNIRSARGMDKKTDYERIAGIITNINPDVIAIQELDSATNRSQRVDALTRIAELTNMYSVYGASIDYDGGKYGIGVMAKEQPISWKRIPLPGKEEARSLLVVEFEHYVFLCTHFSLTEEDRIASADIVNKAVQEYEKPVILSGDFNAHPNSSVIKAFSKGWTMLSKPKVKTFPSNQPTETIDYIMALKQKGVRFSVLQSVVLNEPVASDHLPLFVDVRIK